MSSSERSRGEGWALLGLALALVVLLTGTSDPPKERPWYQRAGKRLLQITVLGLAGFGVWTLVT